jgi:hypothetical protein
LLNVFSKPLACLSSLSAMSMICNFDFLMVTQKSWIVHPYLDINSSNLSLFESPNSSILYLQLDSVYLWLSNEFFIWLTNFFICRISVWLLFRICISLLNSPFQILHYLPF